VTAVFSPSAPVSLIKIILKFQDNFLKSSGSALAVIAIENLLFRHTPPCSAAYTSPAFISEISITRTGAVYPKIPSF
jgi:hypothetical protein